MANNALATDSLGAVLPAVQASVRQEIAERVAAGEFISGIDEKGALITSRPLHFDHDKQRRQLLDDYAARMALRSQMGRASAA